MQLATSRSYISWVVTVATRILILLDKPTFLAFVVIAVHVATLGALFRVDFKREEFIFRSLEDVGIAALAADDGIAPVIQFTDSKAVGRGFEFFVVAIV